MAFDNPWAIDGVMIDADTMRLMAHSAAQGQEGVIGATDLAVRELDVPSDEVSVLPGAFNAKQRAAGLPSQMYTCRVPSLTSVDIVPTGVGVARSDMIVARIGDPNVPGGPEDLGGPYAWPEVISGVSSSARTLAEAGQAGYTAIPLARIDIPAGTSAIEQDMITDLRQLARPNRERRLFAYALVADDTEIQGTVITAGEYWPNLAQWDILIPEWATQATLIGRWTGVLAPAGNVYGRVWVGIGPTAGGAPNTVTTQQIRYDTPGSSQAQRMVLEAPGTVTIPADMRGTVQRFGLRAYKEAASADAARLVIDWASAVSLDVEFNEVPVSEQVS